MPTPRTFRRAQADRIAAVFSTLAILSALIVTAAILATH